MTNEKLPGGWYGLYNPDLGYLHVFQLHAGELIDEALTAKWRVVPLELRALGDATRPAIEPPISLLTELPTNDNARWPFPQLKPKKPDAPRRADQVKYITLHHSAGSRATTNIRYWHRLHTETKGWSRCGYHLGIGALDAGDPIELYEINPLQYVSWHDTRNYDTYAIAVAGDLRAGRDGEPDEKQLACFGRAIAYILPQLPNLESITGHKFWQATACPGDFNRWYVLLVDAARQFGHDIEPLLRFKGTPIARLVRALSLPKYGPPIEHCEDV